MSDRLRPPQPEKTGQIQGTAPVRAPRPAHPANGATTTPMGTGQRTEPRKAVALTYDPAQADAPVVSAVGQGAVAEEIIRRAREAGVPVTEDPRLAAVLSQIDVGRAIPPELYQVIAEVLAYLYRLDERVSRRRS